LSKPFRELRPLHRIYRYQLIEVYDCGYCNTAIGHLQGFAYKAALKSFGEKHPEDLVLHHNVNVSDVVLPAQLKDSLIEEHGNVMHSEVA
jgi:hypothetical protein